MLSTTVPKKKWKSTRKSTQLPRSRNTSWRMGLRTKEEIKEIDRRVKSLVSECEKFAEESAYPPIEQLYDTVYEQEDYPFLPHKL